jgi:hypothetical protein
MSDIKRDSPRFAVSIYMFYEGRAAGQLRAEDLSATGFLAKGRLAAEPGDSLRATFHVFPASGEREVKVEGSVMNKRHEGDETLVGVRITDFGSEAEKKSYLEFVRELAADVGEL